MVFVTAPTLADVAREVGVSRTTVSNAYNRPDQLSPALRARILDAAARLGYPGPDPLARSLRRGRTGTIGLVVDQPLSYLFTDPAIGDFLIGLTMVLDEAEASLALLPRIHADDAGATVLANAAVDGFVSVCDAINAERVQALMVRHLPFVVVDGVASPQPVAWASTTAGRAWARSNTCWRLATAGSRWLPCPACPAIPAVASTPTIPVRCASRSRQPAWRASATASRRRGWPGRPCPSTPFPTT